MTNSSKKRSLKFYRNLADKSFFHFVRICGGYAGEGGIISETIHKPLCDFFQNPIEKRKCFFMPRNWLKCVHPDTLIQMWNGSEKKISDVKTGDKILGFDGFHQIQSVVTNHQEQPADLYKIQFRSGRQIIASSEHRFMQVEGYKPLPKYGAYPRCIKYKPSSSISEDDAILIAYYVAEGCLTSGNMSFTNGNIEIQEDFERIVKSFGWSYSKLKSKNCYDYRINGGIRKYLHTGTPRAWARKRGLYGKSCFEKTLPDSVMSARRSVIKKVIEALFATDGTLGVYNGYPQICYTSVNKRLCLQVQNLLNRFDVFSSVLFIKNEYQGSYIAKVEGRDSFKNFVGHFKIMGKLDAVNRVKTWVKQHDFPIEKSVPNLIPNEVKEQITEVGLRKNGIRVDNNYRISRAKAKRIPSISHFAETEVNWDRVVSCEYYGREQSCDIETTSGNYVADGIITHNSTVFTEWGAIWLYLQNPDIQILIASQNERLAKRFKLFIENQILYNDRLRELYPDRLAEITPEYRHRRGNRWTAEEMYLPRSSRYRGGKEATIQSIGIAGAAQSGHFDWILIDDPVGKKHMESAPELEKVLNWQDNVKELLDNPYYHNPNSSVVQICCTFWGPGDYGSYVMSEYPEYKFKVVPALKYEGLKNTDNVEWIQDPDAAPMTSNWENAPQGRSTTAYYQEMMAHPQQQVIFWSQHMNMPQKAGGLHKFDISWLRPFIYEEREDEYTKEKELWVVCEDDGEAILYDDIPKYGGIDPGGFSETKSARTSKLAMMVAGKSPTSLKKFAFWAWAGRIKEPSRFVADLFQAHAKYKPIKWYIETEGQQPYIYRHIKESRTKGVEWEGKTHYSRGMLIDKFPYDRSRDAKDLAITDLIPSVENGEWYVHKNLCQPLIAELQNYPHGMTKDAADLMGKLYKHRLVTHRPRDWREQMLQKARETASRRGPMGY